MDDLGLNAWLKDNYGTIITGQPRYRVSWTTRQTEKRFGDFNDFYGHIFIRTYRGIREVPKYPYDKDRWVLERAELNDNPELTERVSYEPLYIFRKKSGEFLPLNRKVVEFIINCLENPMKVTPTMLMEQEEKKEEEELEFYRQKIGELMSVPHLMDLVE